METKSCQEGSLWQLTTSPLWKTLSCVITNDRPRHARLLRRVSTNFFANTNVDGRDKPGHDQE
jgi:hypothetical protein